MSPQPPRRSNMAKAAEASANFVMIITAIFVGLFVLAFLGLIIWGLTIIF
jgi:hypothetical protein